MKIFVDTSGWFNLLHVREPEHHHSVELYQSSSIRITTNYILTELVALANSRNIPRKYAQEFIRRVEKDKSVKIIWIDEETHEKAMHLLESRLDKSYSLCDAVSFVVMRENDVTDALTTDRHFRQEGFARLLEEE